MKKIIFIIAFLFTTAFTFAKVSGKGYYRSNGTYVQPHQRTAPNSTRNDNYSTISNSYPYTGEAGTQSGDNYTSKSSYSSSNTTYPTPSYSSSSKTIYTGSRGGRYYINSNGNKTYVSSN
ncbi:hypothetical protein ACNQF7_15635 [Flavobacterium sp. RSP29]|uniref:hypothetical protein n=1 Tax=Flavobacterium sp. RSP29 TaxID=3401731 RepID=UPI003AAFF56B